MRHCCPAFGRLPGARLSCFSTTTHEKGRLMVAGDLIQIKDVAVGVGEKSQSPSPGLIGRLHWKMDSFLFQLLENGINLFGSERNPGVTSHEFCKIIRFGVNHSDA